MNFSKTKGFFKRNIIEIWLTLTLFVVFIGMSVKMEVVDNMCPDDYIWCLPERTVSSYDASLQRVDQGRCSIYGCGGLEFINITYLAIDLFCAYLIAHSIVFLAKRYVAGKDEQEILGLIRLLGSSGRSHSSADGNDANGSEPDIETETEEEKK